MRNYDFEAHLERIRAIYKHKAQLMMKLMDEKFGDKVKYQPIEGGLFLWCTLPDGVDMPAFCKKAVENKVAVVPGNAFLMDEAESCQNFRTNFSTPTDEQLIKGMDILGELVKSL